MTELLGVLPTLSAMLGGAEILPALARAAPSLLAYEEEDGGAPLVGKIVPQGGSASLPALIALLQGAQAGDPRAIADWQRLCDLAMAKACEVVPNIRRARVTESVGEMTLELEGSDENVKKGIAFLEKKGIKVEPVVGDVVS